jgi:prepilin-type N-terminal cleavage/methylation domain-containing protein
MSRADGGLSLVEMLVVLAIVAILASAVVVPRWDLNERRSDMAVDGIAASLADALRRGRAGEDWRLAWTTGRLRLWRPVAADGSGAADRPLALPDGLRIRALAVDGQDWPEDQPLKLAGFATPPLRIELDLNGRVVALRSLPTGRVERLPDRGAP